MCLATVVMHEPGYARSFSGLSVGKVLNLSYDDESEHVKLTAEEEAKKQKSSTARFGRLLRHVDLYQFLYEYRFIQLTTLAIFCQRVGFAFKRVEAPFTYDDFEQFVESLGDIMVFVPELSYWYAFGLSVVASGVFVITFVTQESVEFNKFLFPDNLFYSSTWLFMSTVCSLSSGVLAIPICSYLLKIADCVEYPPGEADNLVLSASLSEEYFEAVMERGGQGNFTDVMEGLHPIQCWTTNHYVACVVAIVMTPMYLVLAVRFIRVDKKLDCIEAVPWQPLDWKADTVVMDTRHHSLSLVNTTSDNASFVVNLILSLVSIFLRDPLVSVLTNFVVQAAFLITVKLYPPYFDEESNQIAELLGWSTLYVFAYAMLAALVDDPDRPEVWIAPIGSPIMLFLGLGYIKRELVKNWWKGVRPHTHLSHTHEGIERELRLSLSFPFAAATSFLHPCHNKATPPPFVHTCFRRPPTNSCHSQVRKSKVNSRRWAQASGERRVKLRQKEMNSSSRTSWVEWIEGCLRKKEVRVHVGLGEMAKESFRVSKKREVQVTAVEAGSSSDEDDVVGAMSERLNVGRGKRGGDGGGGGYEKRSWGGRVAYQLSFVLLLVSLGCMYFSGYMFFHAASFDLNSDYKSGRSFGVAVSFAGVLVSSGCLVAAHETKSGLFVTGLLGLAMAGASVDYGLYRALDGARECVTMPLTFSVSREREGVVAWEYEEGGNGAWEGDEVWEYECPFVVGFLGNPVLAGGSLGYCGCCAGERVQVVLHGDTVGAGGRIDSCVCMSAENVNCTDVEYFRFCSIVSLGLLVALVVVSGCIMLLSVEGAMASFGRWSSKRAALRWEHWKKEKTAKLKKAMRGKNETRRVRARVDVLHGAISSGKLVEHKGGGGE